MAQGGYIGKQIRVGFSTSASPGNWRQFEQVLDCTPPVLKSDKIETTIHDNTSLFKRHIPGLQDVSDVPLTMLRDADPATSPNQNLLFGLLAAQTQFILRIEIHSSADPTVNLFEAYEFTSRVGDVQIKAPINNRTEIMASFMFSSFNSTTFFDHYAPAASIFGALVP